MRRFKPLYCALLLISVIALFTGCNKEPKQSISYEPLTDEQILELKEAWKTQYADSCPTFSLKEAYYGTCDGRIVIFGNNYSSTESVIEIAGIRFYGCSGNGIFVYSDETFCDLGEAYEMEWFTKETIEAIAKYHHDQHLVIFDNPLFEELYPCVRTITITDCSINEQIIHIETFNRRDELLYMFNNWSPETAQANVSDVDCQYLIRFDSNGDILEMGFSRNSPYCSMNGQYYTLPDAFQQRISYYIESYRTDSESCFEPLSQEKIAEIAKAMEGSRFVSKTDIEMLKYRTDEVYYGTYGDSIVLFFDFPDADIDRSTLELEGVRLWSTGYFHVHVYHKGELAGFEEAYKLGWLTKENLRAVGRHFDELHNVQE